MRVIFVRIIFDVLEHRQRQLLGKIDGGKIIQGIIFECVDQILADGILIFIVHKRPYHFAFICKFIAHDIFYLSVILKVGKIRFFQINFYLKGNFHFECIGGYGAGLIKNL